MTPTVSDVLVAGCEAGLRRAEAPICIGTESGEAIGSAPLLQTPCVNPLRRKIMFGRGVVATVVLPSRVAGAVARPGSHGTVRTLFVYGSSGRRVMTPAAGRFVDLESFP